MNELDKMLEAPQETMLSPLVRYCKERQQAGDTIKVELWWPDGLVGAPGAKLVIHRWERDVERDPVQIEWDDGVNAGLVDLKIRAISIENEGGRFALTLRAALRKVERKYGDGFLSAVLLDLLDESDLCKDGEIADVRKHIHTAPAARGRSYHECRDLIANEIGGRAVELRDKLGYKPEETKSVMTKALAIYLDGRFSVSSRRNFGLL